MAFSLYIRICILLGMMFANVALMESHSIKDKVKIERIDKIAIDSIIVYTSQDNEAKAKLLKSTLSFGLHDNIANVWKNQDNELDTILGWGIKLPTTPDVYGKQIEFRLQLLESIMPENFNIDVPGGSISANVDDATKLFWDRKTTQSITLIVKNLVYVKNLKITHDPKTVKFLNNKDSIVISDESLIKLYDENKLVIPIRVSSQSPLEQIKIKLYHIDGNSEFQESEIIVENIKKEFVNTRFAVTSTYRNYLYHDDPANTKLHLDFTGIKAINKGEQFAIVDSGLVKCTNDIMTAPENKIVSVEISTIKNHGIADVFIKKGTEIFTGNINILPTPRIENVTMPGTEQSDHFKFTNIEDARTINIWGNQLNEMKDVKVELVDINRNKVATLQQVDENKSYISCSFKPKDLKVGDYYLRLSREIEAGIIYYPYDTKKITIIYPLEPKHLDTKQVKLDNKLFDKDKGDYFISIDAYQKCQLSFWPTDETKSIPQYLQIVLTYTNNKSAKAKTVILEGENDFIQLFDKTKYYDIPKYFDLEKLDIFETIRIDVQHSNKKYKSTDPIKTETFHILRELSWFDKFSLTVTVPPLIIAQGRVKQKAENENGEVFYSENKKGKIQPLMGNIGLGIKWQPFLSNRKSYSNNVGINFMVMALNVLGQKSGAELVNDLTNDDMIDKGSLGAAFYLEYNLRSFEDSSTRIPVFLGILYTERVLDGSNNIFPSIGITLDLKLFDF